MVFTLKLVAERPTDGELVLKPETPLCGLKFLEEAGKCMRRNLDTPARFKHQTLGALATYEITVPQAIALQSGFFDEKNTRTLVVEANILSRFIFYGASMGYGSSGRACYPYYSNEIILTSYIDELSFIDLWRSRGYPERLTYNPGAFIGGVEIVPDEDDVDGPEVGDMILDDILNGQSCNSAKYF